MHKVSSERPVDPITVEMMVHLEQQFSSQSVDYFLLGATARDIVMYHVFGIRGGKATKDADFAIALENWEKFERIKTLLLASGKYSSAPDIAHRLYYEMEKNETAYPVDLIPFGPIEEKNHHIAWPPDKAIVMNVAGYEEALQTSILVEIVHGLVIRVVSIPGLAALKLLAWADRGQRDPKDAPDFYFLLRNYANAGNQTRLYEEAMGLLEQSGYDADLAGAALLGFDSRAIGLDTIQHMLHIFDDNTKSDRLVLHMGGRSEEESKATKQYLQQFRAGLLLTELPSWQSEETLPPDRPAD